MIRLGVIAAGIIALPVGGLAFRPASVSGAPAATPPRIERRRDSLATVERATRRLALLAHDPFRRTRTPTDRPYDAWALEAAKQAAAAPPPPPHPMLSVSGILFGPRPSVLVEGIPGAEGARLLHQGDTTGGLRVRAITRTHAIISGFDTLWTLPIRETWR